MSDVLVVGGGVIGLSIAWELSQVGRTVTVVEQGDVGREASWAGAGILPPGLPEPSPLSPLYRRTHELWPAISAQLLDETGVDNGFSRCGGIEFTSTPDMTAADEAAAWRAAGARVEIVSPSDIERIEPEVRSPDPQAYLLPDVCQVRNPRHLKSLRNACAARGVEFLLGQPVMQFRRGRDGGVQAAITPTAELAAGQFIVAAGAWSRALLAPAGITLDVEPVRGQIVLLQTRRRLFRHVLEAGPRYLVPRPDGRVLIGATEEWVGFCKENTAAAVAGLLEFGCGLAPALRDAALEKTWSGLRPHARRGLPYLGPVPDAANLFVAAGHFRAGLHLSPITGRLMRQLLCGETPELPLDAFGVG